MTKAKASKWVRFVERHGVVLAWWRRRRQNRRRIEQWEAEDRARREAAPPPYIAWPGDDPFADPDADERPDDPRLLN